MMGRIVLKFDPMPIMVVWSGMVQTSDGENQAINQHSVIIGLFADDMSFFKDSE
jgi:hypothetical protein